MKETQESIAKWCEETFGPAGSLRVAVRANEEYVELLEKLHTAGCPPESLVEEMADIVITLCRVCAAVGEDIGLDGPTLDAPPESLVPHVVHAGKALSRVMRVFSASGDQDNPQQEAAHHLSLLFANLFLAARAAGLCLSAAIDKKMEVNRARVWQKDGTGCGYHVRQK